MPPTNENEFELKGVPNELMLANRARKPKVRVCLPDSILARASLPANSGKKRLYSIVGSMVLTLPPSTPPEYDKPSVKACPSVGSSDEFSVLNEIVGVSVDCVTPFWRKVIGICLLWSGSLLIAGARIS